jgi:hypothetical protein
MWCPPIRFRRPGSAIQPSGVQPVRCPVTWVRRPGSGGPDGLVSTRPASSRPASSRPVSSRPVSASVGPDASGSSHTGRWRWGPDECGGATCTTGTGRGPGGLPRRRAARASASRPGAGDAAEVARWSVGSLAAGPGWVRCGAAARDRLSDQAGQAGVRSARGWRREGTGAGRRREVAAPAVWLPLLGWVATTVRGRRGACRPGRRGPEGPMGLPAGWACGPSAAQAGSERSRLAVSSAVTWGDGWWACQDLNLGPHPYQSNDTGKQDRTPPCLSLSHRRPTGRSVSRLSGPLRSRVVQLLTGC